MTDHSRQALVGTFGARYVSLAIADIDELSISNFALLSTADFEAPMQAVERYLASVPRCPDLVSIALAGTVDGDKAKFTYRNWTLSKNDVRATTRATQVVLVNDIEATALVLPNLAAYELRDLQPGKAVPYANKAVLMAGAAVGMAGLVRAGEAWTPVVGEGGFMRFVLSREDEAELGEDFLKGRYLSCDEVFTGAGLTAVYGALCAQGKGAAQGRRPQADRCRGPIDRGCDRDQEPAGDGRLAGTGRGGSCVALRCPRRSLYGRRPRFQYRAGACRQATSTMPSTIVVDMPSDLAEVPVHVIKTAADTGLRGAALAMSRAQSASAARHAPPARQVLIRRPVMHIPAAVREVLDWYDGERPGVKASLARLLMHGRTAGVWTAADPAGRPGGRARAGRKFRAQPRCL